MLLSCGLWLLMSICGIWLLMSLKQVTPSRVCNQDSCTAAILHSADAGFDFECAAAAATHHASQTSIICMCDATTKFKQYICSPSTPGSGGPDLDTQHVLLLYTNALDYNQQHYLARTQGYFIAARAKYWCQPCTLAICSITTHYQTITLQDSDS